MAERNPGDASNQQAPPVDGGGGGSRFGRIAVIVVALILLLLAVPFACQAIRGGGSDSANFSGEDNEGSSSETSAGQSSGSSGGSSGSQMESTMQAASGSTTMESSMSEGTTMMSSGGAEDTSGGSSGGSGSGAPEAEISGLAAGQLTGGSGDGTSVTVPSATLSGAAGWVAVSENDGSGEPGEILGYAPLEAGENENVSVPLDSPVSGSGELLVSVHEDAPADQGFSYPDGDPTAQTASGQTATESVPYDLAGTNDGVQIDELPDSGGVPNLRTYLIVGLGTSMLALGLALNAGVRRS